MINKNVLDQVRSSFSAQRFQEMYGVILCGGQEKFITLPNKSLKPNSFVIDSRLWMIRSKILCIAHSHVYSDAYPSDKDKRIVEMFCKPFLIYSCLFDNFLYLDNEKCKPM
jgi:proteasome lid subunit RPN8/RPN11